MCWRGGNNPVRTSLYLRQFQPATRQDFLLRTPIKGICPLPIPPFLWLIVITILGTLPANVGPLVRGVSFPMRMGMKRFLMIPLVLFLAISSTAVAQVTSTWSRIQQRVLTPRCSNCHVAGSLFATQSGLVLTSDVAYTNLVDVQPKNSAARADGLLRTSSEGTLTGLSRSFLWEKINAPNESHFNTDHPYYGALMPLGAPPLTNGELQYIQDWIIAGSPQAGEVADTLSLNDTSRYSPPPFTPLSPPAQGIQYHLGPFSVQPNAVNDREFFKYTSSSSAQDQFVNHVEITMRPGSHHFILYLFDDATPAFLMPPPDTHRDIRDSLGNENSTVLFQMYYHRFFFGTQYPYSNYHFPPGIALRLPANKGLDLNSHYVNRSGSPINGEVYANLHTVEAGQVQRVADILFLNNTELTLPPQQVTTIEKTFMFPQSSHIIYMWSHSHEHTTAFEVRRSGGMNDGQLVYFSNDWHHPPILHLDPPLTINAGEGLTLKTTYNNGTNDTIRFGLQSSDEMQILYGAYYTGSVLHTETDKPLPSQFALEQNFPNPFNPSTSLRYSIPGRSFVTLKVFDLLGREVRTLVQVFQPAGRHVISFEAGGLPTGVYVCRLQAVPENDGNGSSLVMTRKIVLVK